MQRESGRDQKGREKKILTREGGEKPRDSGDKPSGGGRQQRRGDERGHGNAETKTLCRSVVIEGILTRSK